MRDYTIPYDDISERYKTAEANYIRISKEILEHRENPYNHDNEGISIRCDMMRDAERHEYIMREIKKEHPEYAI